MRKTQIIGLNALVALLFALLFFKNYIGINLFLYELVVVPIMLYLNRPVKFNKFTIAVISSVFLSSVMIVLLNTSWSIFINIIMLIVLSGTLSYKGFRSFIHAFLESIIRFFSSQFSIFMEWPGQAEVVAPTKKSKLNVRKLFYVLFLPALIFILFIIIYASASSVFYKQFESVFTAIANFFRSINFVFVLVFILGLIISNALFMRTFQVGLHKNDLAANDILFRSKPRYFIPFKFTGLRLQNLSGIVLLASLNVLIFYFNILDITHLWIGYKWDGSFLKEFVHEGTWLLVLSVFLSAAITLFYFNKNLNFFSKNTWLKRLAVLWISQNFVMVISVVIRNYWYITYFGLAYKRIAVLFFLLLTLVGLIAIIVKIYKRKSSFYLWKVNGFALMAVLVLTTCVNWDLMIAKFNFKHYDRSLIDFRFMARLNNSALPYTVKTYSELQEINAVQEKAMPFDIHQDYLWDITIYETEVLAKRERFLTRYEGMSFLEWNLADYQTYRKLKGK